VRDLGVTLVLVGAVVVVHACSVFEPDVGPLQSDGAASACDLGASGYGTTYGAPTGSSATTDFCTVDGGTIQGECDSCEVASCCTQRVACYSDQACSCADQTLDTCLGPLPTGEAGLGDAGPAAAACWSTFSGVGSIGQARYACLRASCAGPCQIPD
jgi:hypothetical protein